MSLMGMLTPSDANSEESAEIIPSLPCPVVEAAPKVRTEAPVNQVSLKEIDLDMAQGKVE